jgi:predicted metal-dependent hydrolase
VKADKAAGKTVGQINKLPDDIDAFLNHSCHEQQQHDHYITAEKVKNEYLSHTESYDTLLNLFEKHSNDVKELVATSKSVKP